jgi:hypothetical protein
MGGEMGACGCNEIQIVKHVLSVGEYVLVVELYPGCEYCHTGLSVNLYMFSRERASDYMFEPTGVFEPDEWGSAQIYTPILNVEDLKRNIPPNFDQYDDVKDWLDDVGLQWLQSSLWSGGETVDGGGG